MGSARFVLVGLGACLVAYACGDDPVTAVDAAAAGDAGLDAGVADGGALDAAADAAVPPVPCDVLEIPAEPQAPAAASGRIEILDYDTWDETSHRRLRVRNDATNFLTQTIPPSPLSDGALYRGITLETCRTVIVPAPSTPLGPPRNIGTSLIMSDELGTTLTRRRGMDDNGVHYRTFATPAEQQRYFDAARTPLSRRWTYRTPGDPGARISPATTTIEAVEDFEVTPAFTSTSAPLRVDSSGFTVRWTRPRTTSGDVAVVLGKALNMQGDARYVICRPADDGEYEVSESTLVNFGYTRGLPFSFAVSRGAVAPFCNEGVPAGVAHHVLAYLGAVVVP